MTTAPIRSIEKAEKPLGRKAYGSIPHLVGSRRGPQDYGVHPGQHRICCEKVRDRHDLIVVQEKLDGSCCSVALHEGRIIAMTRAGYLASTSPYEQHHVFGAWVAEREAMFRSLLTEGERVVGEWIAQAHGTRYENVADPFIAFDIMRGVDRAIVDDVEDRCAGKLPIPRIVWRNPGPLSIADALREVGAHGHHGAVDPVEGAVWRVERQGKVDFLAKFVVADKVDGKYLPELTGADPVWNWRPQARVAA